MSLAGKDAGYAGAIYHEGASKVLLHDERSKLKLATGGGLVGLAAQQEVLTKGGPAIVVAVVMDRATQTALGGAHRIAQLAIKATLYHVADAGGAVVVEETVAIDAVLGLTVDQQGIEDAAGLQLSDIEHLLVNVDALAVVSLNEVHGLLHGADIVGVAQGKAQGKIAGIEVEDAVVEHEVEISCVGAHHADGGVTVVFIYLRTWAAGEEADLQTHAADGVAFGTAIAGVGHNLSAHHGSQAITHAALTLAEGGILLQDVADDVVLRNGKSGAHC